MGWLDGKVALITGGASGMGLALVQRFVAEGARIVAVDRSAERLAELNRTYKSNTVTTCQADISGLKGNQIAVSHALDAFGKLDTFIANAGVFDNFRPLAKTDPEQVAPAFDELFSVNVRAGILGARATLPALVKSRGSLIYTVSNAGFYPGGGGVLYTASKHALVGVIKQLAHEFAPHVRVNGVAPGGMRTNLTGLAATGTDTEMPNQVDGFEALLSSVTPLAIAPSPAQYCGPYVLLASDENSAPMTGSIINTDGGFGVRGIMAVRGDVVD